MSAIDEIDYGPLAALIGTWQGDKGMDIAPDPKLDREENPYYETITFVPFGDVTNADRQVLSGLRYHQSVRRKSNDEIFHDECGYWLWEAATNTIVHSLQIPRAVAIMAGGVYTPGASGIVTLEVKAGINNKDWSIVQSPFMRDNAKTVAFRHKITVDGDSMTYFESTMLDIYGRKFEHTDENTLTRAKS
jgi:methylamine---glutamate N-methyltransferase subunit C